MSIRLGPVLQIALCRYVSVLEPCFPVQPIQYMRPERMSLRQAWMLKVVLRIMCHPEFFHDTAGPEIGWNSKRNNVVKSEILEPTTQHFACAFGGESLAPV